ncbi:hypothetical protein E4497_17575 [Escherichia coli]|nr:hypothetical protein [Escherichia coli]MCI5310305.1 hypothetical protein [Escherichia coli]
MGNILFDEKNNRFWPIDFSNSYEHYYSIDKDSKLFVNEMADREFCSILKTLRENAISNWICPYISRHLLSLNPLQARCRRYSRGER